MSFFQQKKTELHIISAIYSQVPFPHVGLDLAYYLGWAIWAPSELTF